VVEDLFGHLRQDLRRALLTSATLRALGSNRPTACAGARLLLLLRLDLGDGLGRTTYLTRCGLDISFLEGGRDCFESSLADELAQISNE
jgi:hypothetical protein